MVCCGISIKTTDCHFGHARLGPKFLAFENKKRYSVLTEHFGAILTWPVNEFVCYKVAGQSSTNKI